jgi:23S rRNA (uracil1939-C5)-methyltransferase
MVITPCAPEVACVSFPRRNDAVATHLADTMAALISPNESLLIDAYCGAGFFAKRLPRKISPVVGLDWDVHAIAAAEANVTEAEAYIAGDLHFTWENTSGRPIQRPPRWSSIRPRPAWREMCVKSSGAIHPGRYFTSLAIHRLWPATSQILALTFTLESVTPFDMFPQTAEIEVLAHLTGA